MSKKDSRRRDILKKIAQNEAQKIESAGRLVGREWVWPKQIEALARLTKKLDKEIADLQKELDAIGGG